MESESEAASTNQGVFSFLFSKKKRFWSIILQNETKHYAKFLVKEWLFSILEFGNKKQKKIEKESQEALTRTINYAFWMEHLEKFSILYFITSK